MSLESTAKFQKLNHTAQDDNEDLGPEDIPSFKKEETQAPEIVPDEQKPEFNETKSIIFALLVALLFALHNFFLGNLANYGYLARLVSGIGMFVCALAHYAVDWFEAYQKKKHYWTWEKSILIDQDTGSISWWVVFAIVVNAVNVIIGGFGVIYSFKFALETNINLGIVSSIFGLTPFLTAVFFYCVFSETLKKAQLFGMVFMVACIVLIGFGVKDHEKEVAAQDPYHSIGGLSKAFWAIFLAILCPISFALNGVIVRIVSSNFGVRPSEFTSAYYVLQSGSMIMGSVFAYTFDSYTFDLGDFLQIVFSGIIAGLGSTVLSRAVTIGYAGVVYSLINGQVIFLTILNAVFYFQVPTSIEMVAAALGIVGSCIMSVGPDIYDQVKQKLFRRSHEE